MEEKRGRPLVARPPGGGFPAREPDQPAELTLASAAAHLRSHLLAAGITEDTAEEMMLEWWRHQLANPTGRNR